MNEAIEKYREHLTEKQLKPVSVDTTEYRLRWFFTDPELDLIDLSANRCSKLYEQLRQRRVRGDRLISTDSQRAALSEVKTFLDWCNKRGWVAANPATGIEPGGRKKRGKPQLRVDEARTFAVHCPAQASEDPGAVGALLCLLLGLRASEACGLSALEPKDSARE